MVALLFSMKKTTGLCGYKYYLPWKYQLDKNFKFAAILKCHETTPDIHSLQYTVTPLAILLYGIKLKVKLKNNWFLKFYCLFLEKK